MAGNNYPIFVAVAKAGMVRISAANTSRDGTGTLYSVITGATNGTRVDQIHIKANVTTTAGMIRLFLNDGGSNTMLWDEVAVVATTATGTSASFKSVLLSPDTQSPLLVLPNAYILKAATNNAESFDVIAQGGDF